MSGGIEARPGGAGPAAAEGAWFWRAQERPDASVRVVCFPHAGASAPFFRDWPGLLGDDVEVLALQLPGRGYRAREPSAASLSEAAGRAARPLRELLDKPCLLFGHSDGALFAFELARLMQQAGSPVSHIVMSARAAPSVAARRPPLHLATEEALVDWLRRAGGTPEEILTDPDFMAIALPILRNDLALSENHRVAPEPALDCPATLLYAESDREVSKEEVAAWSALLPKSELASIPGDHFAHVTHQPELIGKLRSIVDHLLPAGAQ